MDVLVELFVSTVVALAAAVFAQFGVPLGGDDADQGRVRRSPVAASAPAEARVTRVTGEEDCPELKARRAVIRVDAEAIAAERLHQVVQTVVAQADEDSAEAAAMAAEMLAEREAERLEAAAERAHAVAERMADDAAA